MFISNIFNNTEFIRFAILTLNYLVKNGYATKDTDDEKIYIIILALNEKIEDDCNCSVPFFYKITYT
jgi:hypothetical protein